MSGTRILVAAEIIQAATADTTKYIPDLFIAFTKIAERSKKNKLDKIFPKAEVDRIKLFAFNEGNPIEYYGSMIGVIIRDKYLEVKGINIAEVDANDPGMEA